MTLQPISHAVVTKRCQPPERVAVSRTQASSISQRGGPEDMGHFSPDDPFAAITSAYALSRQGRKQAALAVSRLESLIFRTPGIAPQLASSAMTYLCGEDLTASGGVQSASQAIIRRLNEALDGHSAKVTKALLEPPDIDRLRVFRQEIRNLIKRQD